MTEVPANAPDKQAHYMDVNGMLWEPSGFDGIDMKILYKDDQGRSTIMFRLAPGAVVPAHEHTDFEQTFVLEGSLEDSEGACTAGNYVWRPAGNQHVAHAPHGAVILSIFTKPNRFFSGAEFFTEAKP